MQHFLLILSRMVGRSLEYLTSQHRPQFYIDHLLLQHYFPFVVLVKVMHLYQVVLLSHFISLVLQHLSPNFKVELQIFALVEEQCAQDELKLFAAPPPHF